MESSCLYVRYDLLNHSFIDSISQSVSLSQVEVELGQVEPSEVKSNGVRWSPVSLMELSHVKSCHVELNPAQSHELSLVPKVILLNFFDRGAHVLIWHLKFCVDQIIWGH